MGRGQAEGQAATATVARSSTTNSPRREHDREVAHAKAVYDRAISPQKAALDAARAELGDLSPEAHTEAVRKLEEGFLWDTSDALQLRDSVIYGAGQRLKSALADKRPVFTSG